MSGRQVHRNSTLMLSLAMLAIGVALAGEAIGGSEGVISARLLLAILFLVAGSARIYLEIRKGRGA